MPHMVTVEKLDSVSTRAGEFEDCWLVTDVTGGANATATWYCSGPRIVRREVPGCGSGNPYGSYSVFELLEWEEGGPTTTGTTSPRSDFAAVCAEFSPGLPSCSGAEPLADGWIAFRAQVDQERRSTRTVSFVCVISPSWHERCAVHHSASLYGTRSAA